jgi:hypothetical protein
MAEHSNIGGALHDSSDDEYDVEWEGEGVDPTTMDEDYTINQAKEWKVTV